MAGHAKSCGVGKYWFLAGEVVRVASKWTVAGFASDIGMGPFAFSGVDIAMTRTAGLVAAEDGSTGRDFNEGAGAVMSVLAELDRNEGMTNCEESQHENNPDECQPDQVFPALEDSSHHARNRASAPPFLCRAASRIPALLSKARKGVRAPYHHHLGTRGGEFLRRIARNNNEVLR